MACLSLYRDNRLPPIAIANPVFVTSPIELKNGAEVTFEVFEQDAAALKGRVDKDQRYVLDSKGPFWAQLKCLDLCESTHPMLAHLRHKETQKGLARLGPKERLKGVLYVMRMEETWFEQELEVFRTEIEAAVRFFYAYLAVHNVAARSEPVFSLLNEAALFWNTSLAGLQTAAFIALGRMFDQKSKHNLDKLLSLAQKNLYIFSKDALGRRKQGPDPEPPVGLSDYLRNAYVPAPEDFRSLRKEVKTWRGIYESTYRDIRHKFFAHKEVSDQIEIDALFAKTNIDETQRMLIFLSSLNDVLWQLFFNGNKLDISLHAGGSDLQGRITSEVEQFLLKTAGVGREP
jgi:hypothetical protein